MEPAQQSLPHEVGGVHDTLRFGLPGVKSDILTAHPLQVIQENSQKQHREIKRNLLSNMYGSAFPLKMDIEQQILSRFQRPPGPLPSSMLGLESLTGTLDEFSVEDYLNDPRESETFVPAEIHHGMEVRLGLSKGPSCRTFM
uniref:Proteasome maturation protein n=1 Tax=Araucaria cunninghamii TaxID=56994 RepID=A0A0D6QTE6_ARACU